MPSGTICLEHTCICICKITSKTRYNPRRGTHYNSYLSKVFNNQISFRFRGVWGEKHTNQQSEKTKVEKKKQTNQRTPNGNAGSIEISVTFFTTIPDWPAMHGAQRFHNPNGTQCRHPLAAGLVSIVCAIGERFFFIVVWGGGFYGFGGANKFAWFRVQFILGHRVVFKTKWSSTLIFNLITFIGI